MSRSRSAESQALNWQARYSGVIWGGVWKGNLPHLFGISSIIRTCGVDVLLVDLICSLLKIVIVFQCQPVELNPISQEPAGAIWCLDLKAIMQLRQLFTKRSLSFSSCNFIIRLI